MFTEIGKEGTDCCPELSQSDSPPFKALRWVLMSLKLMKDPDAGQEVIYLAEDTDLSQWHLGTASCHPRCLHADRSLACLKNMLSV